MSYACVFLSVCWRVSCFQGFEVELPKAGFTNATLYLNCKGIFIVEPNAKGGQASEGDESFKVLFSHMFEISPASPAPESVSHSVQAQMASHVMTHTITHTHTHCLSLFNFFFIYMCLFF